MNKLFQWTAILTLLVALQACQQKQEKQTGEQPLTENVTSENSNLEGDTTSSLPASEAPALDAEKAPDAAPSEDKKPTSSKPASQPTKKTKQPSKPANNISNNQPTKSDEPIAEESKPEPKPEPKPAPKNDKADEQPKVEAPQNDKPAKPALSHSIWNGLLKKYVTSSGKVNYAGIKGQRSTLREYLDILEANPPQSNWPRNKEMAYWINAYNAYTVDLIVDNYPISSILKLDNGKTWYVKRINIGGKKYSLDDIEKDILIGKFKEPRIHFAINCAAKSCPPLMNEAWEANTLEADLNRMTKNFINDDANNSISKKSAKLSKIFDWYKADFGDVNDFINKYSAENITSKTKISYNEYDWDLNN